jgi:hypothetical protein
MGGHNCGLRLARDRQGVCDYANPMHPTHQEQMSDALV